MKKPIPNTRPQAAQALVAHAQAHIGQLTAALPAISAELAGVQEEIIRSAMIAQEKGELSPEMAKDLWIQLFSAHRLQRRMATKVQMANAAIVNQMKGATTNGKTD